MKELLASLVESAAMLALGAGAVLVAALLLVGGVPSKPAPSVSGDLVVCPLTGETIPPDACPLQGRADP